MGLLEIMDFIHKILVTSNRNNFCAYFVMPFFYGKNSRYKKSLNVPEIIF